jgi:Coenzyme PQQ synthesis protein D (PqqD)
MRDLAEGEGAVLLHLDSGQYHGINPVGQAIWELLADGGTVGEVVDRLRDRVEAPPPSLESDVLRFLTSIHERDLVVVER